MSEYTVIHDAIHGPIEVRGKIKKIIDHPVFERCNYIFQTGLAYRVFPSGTHTRKIHQIGTYFITHQLLNHLSKFYPITDKIKELIEIGALIHDIGHGPGSHAFDSVVLTELVADGVIDENNSWVDHENRSISLLNYIADDIGLDDADIVFISEVIEPSTSQKNWEFSIVNNNLNGFDTDKLDYILRDSHMIGLKTKIDLNSIILHSRIIDNEICYDKEIQDVLREVVFARYQIHRRLNDSNVCKFDLSFGDICLSEPIYSQLIEIVKTHNCEEFCKITDSYILQNGDKEKVDAFNSRDSYIPIESFVTKNLEETVERTKKYADDTKYKILNNKIKICKNGNILSNISFYDRKTMKKCEVSQSLIDSVPSFEILTHIYEKSMK